MKRNSQKFGLALLLLILISFLLTITPVNAKVTGDYSIKKSYKRVSDSLVRVRGLQFKKTIPYSMKSKTFLRKFIMKALKEELPGEKFKAFDITLKKFGFLPENFDTWNFIINLYTSEVAGLYDYRTKQLMLMKEQTNIPGMAQQEAMLRQYGISVGDILLIHEMQHGLQDQYFDLAKMLKRAKVKKSDDCENAVLAVIEGDATMVMMLYMMDSIGKNYGMDLTQFMDLSQMKDMMADMPMQGGGNALQNAPLYFKRTMLFPYLDGMVFVDNLKKRGGWTMVNNAFKNPPRSTEQILHAQRYHLKDEPVMLQWTKLPKTLGGWKMITQNTCGELIVKILFEKFMPEADYKSIAKGWGGDRYRIYKKGNKAFLIWFTNWDRDQDAKEFMKYYLELLKKKYPAVKWTKTIPNKAYLGKLPTGYYVYLAINGDDVLAIETFPQKFGKQLMKEGWLVSRKKMQW